MDGVGGVLGGNLSISALSESGSWSPASISTLNGVSGGGSGGVWSSAFLSESGGWSETSISTFNGVGGGGAGGSTARNAGKAASKSAKGGKGKGSAGDGSSRSPRTSNTSELEDEEEVGFTGAVGELTRWVESEVAARQSEGGAALQAAWGALPDAAALHLKRLQAEVSESHKIISHLVGLVHREREAKEAALREVEALKRQTRGS